MHDTRVRFFGTRFWNQFWCGELGSCTWRGPKMGTPPRMTRLVRMPQEPEVRLLAGGWGILTGRRNTHRGAAHREAAVCVPIQAVTTAVSPGCVTSHLTVFTAGTLAFVLVTIQKLTQSRVARCSSDAHSAVLNLVEGVSRSLWVGLALRMETTYSTVLHGVTFCRTVYMRCSIGRGAAIGKRSTGWDVF